MGREILTFPLSASALWEELSYLVEHARYVSPTEADSRHFLPFHHPRMRIRAPGFLARTHPIRTLSLFQVAGFFFFVHVKH